MNINENRDENATFTDEGNLDSPVYRRKSKAKLRAINVGVIAAVVAINILFGLLASSGLWFVDLTSTRYLDDDSTLYRITDTCLTLIGDEAIPMIDSVNAERAAQGEEPIKLNIIFCTDPDYIENSELRYVLYTARALKKEYSEYIDIKFINMTENPSAVQKYKVTSAANIYPTNVIIEFGTEYVVHADSSFFTTDTDSGKIWAYNGEKKLTASILSVTRAEAPICCITTNHGESLYGENGEINERYTTFIRVIEGAGYLVMPLDLEREEIPENCRMMITFAPTKDFKAYGSLGESGVSEIEKLDKYLDNAYSFFYVCDRDTPRLDNLEEYLAEWGISIARVANAAEVYENYAVKDSLMNVDSGKGDNLIGQFSSAGTGAGLLGDLLASGYPPKVIFPNSTAIVPSDVFKKIYVEEDAENGTPAHVTYGYNNNGIARYMYDVFTTYDSALAEVGGETYEMASSESQFKMMTITQEIRRIQEDSYGYSSVNDASYVMALSSSDFVSNEVLDSTAYGNTDVLLAMLRGTGKEVIPVNIDFKAYYVYDIDDGAVVDFPVGIVTACLICIPALIALVVGTVVCVKRKNG